MSTAQFNVVAIVLLVLATMRRPDFTTGTVAIGFAASAVVPSFRNGAELLPIIATIDAVICLAMLSVWTAYNSMRAWSIGFIGVAKCGWAWAAAFGIIEVNSWGFALPFNAAFIAQVVIAGGCADAIGDRLDRMLWRFFPRRHFLLRNGPR